ncbi:guanylate kinase [Anaerosphaera multitolerans]|uniref:Guanylate kinase n=1 Tax=Anaerosphaera multitolerans TaxID=2487351 RepID=A0A437S9P4_9FIRM|nr:AAA family ATPase [Anaerosphaera multitolerans]RVU55528.1 guanylate kinase [Anaerosphaera multitolerans]
MIYLIVGASGTGKTTQANLLRKKDNFFKIITYTTRKKREGEVNGLDYHFLSVPEFLKLKKQDFFLETTHYSNNYYGTPKAEFKKYIDSENNAVVVVDLNGVKKIKSEFKNAICIYLKSNVDTMVERMKERGDSSEKIEERIKAAQDFSSYADFIIDASKSVEDISKEIDDIVNKTQKKK